MSLTTVTLNGDQGQAHYWTGVSDRPNSDAGTEGMQRSLWEYQDQWGPNELVAPISVVYAPDACEACVEAWWTPPQIQPWTPVVVVPSDPPAITPEAATPEPSAVATVILGLVVILAKWRLS
jgi:hypothetical protein